MAFEIQRSVGDWNKGAVNLPDDVKTVQKMLRQAAKLKEQPDWDPKGTDGKISWDAGSSDTVHAIKAFQSSFLSKPDGVIEVNKKSWTMLQAALEKAKPDAVSPNKGEQYFPFPKLPASDWVSGARKFAANRSGSSGKRAHAGCDLYFPQGTPIYAVADGKVTLGPYFFYNGTYALEVDHGDFIVRYGEVQEATLVKKGDTVKAGQKIARVGHLVGISVPSDMLHFEMYDKSEKGPLTVGAAQSKRRADGVPFLRRKDLLDPTPFLNKWSKHLPKAY